MPGVSLLLVAMPMKEELKRLLAPLELCPGAPEVKQTTENFMQSEFYNQPVVAWAQRNLPGEIEIKLKFNSLFAKFFLTLLLFALPIGTALYGLLLYRVGNRSFRMFFEIAGYLFVICALVGLLVLTVGYISRIGMIRYLDAQGVRLRNRVQFKWESLQYLNYKRYRSPRGHPLAGLVLIGSIPITIELIFETGKAVIPPLIFDQEEIHALIETIPAQVRYDGVIRDNQSAMPAGNNTGNRGANSAPVVSLEELINLTARPATQRETVERLKREKDEREVLRAAIRRWQSGQIESGALLRTLISFDKWTIPAEEEEFYKSVDENRLAEWAVKEENGAKCLCIFFDADVEKTLFHARDGFVSLILTGTHIFGSLDERFDFLYINPSSETAITYDRGQFPMLREMAAAVKAERQSFDSQKKQN